MLGKSAINLHLLRISSKSLLAALELLRAIYSQISSKS